MNKVIKPDPPWPLKAMIIVGICAVSIIAMEQACLYFIKLLGLYDIQTNHIPRHVTQLELKPEELPRTYYMTEEPTPMEINGYSVMLPYAYTEAVSSSYDTRLTADETPHIVISETVELPELKIRWGCLSGRNPIATAFFLMQVNLLGCDTWSELLMNVHQAVPRDLRRAKTAYSAMISYFRLRFKSDLTYGGTRRYYKPLPNGHIAIEALGGKDQPEYVILLIRMEGHKAYASQIVVWETYDKDHPLAEVAYIANNIQPINYR